MKIRNWIYHSDRLPEGVFKGGRLTALRPFPAGDRRQQSMSQHIDSKGRRTSLYKTIHLVRGIAFIALLTGTIGWMNAYPKIIHYSLLKNVYGEGPSRPAGAVRTPKKKNGFSQAFTVRWK